MTMQYAERRIQLSRAGRCEEDRAIIVEFSADVHFPELSEGRNRGDITDSWTVSVATGKSLPLFEDIAIRCQNFVAHEKRAKKSVVNDAKKWATRIAPGTCNLLCLRTCPRYIMNMTFIH